MNKANFHANSIEFLYFFETQEFSLNQSGYLPINQNILTPPIIPNLPTQPNRILMRIAALFFNLKAQKNERLNKFAMEVFLKIISCPICELKSFEGIKIQKKIIELKRAQLKEGEQQKLQFNRDFSEIINKVRLVSILLKKMLIRLCQQMEIDLIHLIKGSVKKFVKTEANYGLKAKFQVIQQSDLTKFKQSAI